MRRGMNKPVKQQKTVKKLKKPVKKQKPGKKPGKLVTSLDELKTGMSVTCQIYDKAITDAKVFVDLPARKFYVCQNDYSGIDNCPDMFGYKYAWVVILPPSGGWLDPFYALTELRIVEPVDPFYVLLERADAAGCRFARLKAEDDLLKERLKKLQELNDNISKNLADARAAFVIAAKERDEARVLLMKWKGIAIDLNSQAFVNKVEKA
jgi:hypothetical protein